MKKFKRHFKKEIKIDFKKRLVVSVSGGVDSMVLLDFLRKMNLDLVVVHFNHQIRPESDLEASLVSDYCSKYNLSFNYFLLDFTTKTNFEEKARNLRRKHLEEVAKRVKTPYIFTGHHLDDLVETVLMKFTRGSNLLGYSGMEQITQDKDFIYVKPFLYISKDDLLDYANRNNLKHMTDNSNYTLDYTRNRFRNAIIPILKQENENLLTQTKQYSRQLLFAYKFIRENTLNYWKENDSIIISQFKKLNRAVQDDVICYYLEQNNININYRIIHRIRKTLLSSKPNQTISLSNNMQLVKFYEKAILKPKSEVYFKKIPTEKGLKIETTFSYSTKRPTSNKAISVKLNYNKLSFPLICRNRKDGDILEFNYGRKKLKKLLIDSKINYKERNDLIVITDSNNKILWIPGYYFNQTLGTKNQIYLSYEGGIIENGSKK